MEEASKKLYKDIEYLTKINIWVGPLSKIAGFNKDVKINNNEKINFHPARMQIEKDLYNEEILNNLFQMVLLVFSFKLAKGQISLS